MRRLIRRAVFVVGVAEIVGAICFPWIDPGSRLAGFLRMPQLEVVFCLLAALAALLAVDYLRGRPWHSRTKAAEALHFSFGSDGGRSRERLGRWSG